MAMQPRVRPSAAGVYHISSEKPKNMAISAPALTQKVKVAMNAAKTTAT
jgi:hypothetical protein